jgi:hypothetical protein
MKEDRQTGLSEPFASAGKIFDLPDWKVVDNGVENLGRERLKAR